MKEINWKSLSLSLIISTIVNGTVLLFEVIQYINSVSVCFNGMGKYLMNSSINNSKVAMTIAYGKPFPLWAGVLIFSMSYIVITLISYFIIEALNKRKK